MTNDMWILTDAGMAFLLWGFIGIILIGVCVYIGVCFYCKKGEDE